MTIKRRVLIAVAAFFAISNIFFGILTYQNAMEDLLEADQDFAKDQTNLFTSILAADAEGLARAHVGLTRLDPLLSLFAKRNRDRLLKEALPIFKEIKQKNSITHMYFIEPDGTVFLRVHKPGEAGDRLARATFRKARDSGSISSGLELGQNFFSLRSVHPVSYRGQKIGFLEVAEEIDHVLGRMKRINGSDVGLFLFAAYLEHQPTHVKGDNFSNHALLYPTSRDLTLKLAAKLQGDMEKAKQGFTLSIVGLNDQRFAVGMGPVRDASGNTVGVLFSHKNVSAGFAAMWQHILFRTVSFTLLLLASLFFLYLSLKKSIAFFADLKKHIEAYATNDSLTEPLEVCTRDEIGVLAHSFNAMLSALEKQRMDLKKDVQFLGTLMETMPMPIFYKDVQDGYLGHNSAFTALLGLTEAEVNGKGGYETALGEFAAQHRQMEKELFARREKKIYESKIYSRNGMIHDVVIYKAPFYNSDGTLGGLVGSMLDITELKRTKENFHRLNVELDQRVSERTAELETAIREQESFSYSVSHDLRAPLRHINSFSAMLIEDFGTELPSGARSYLDRICAASSRMGSLIDHLLELSRMNRTELKLEGIDLSELAMHVLDMFHETDPQRLVETRVTESIRVLGDLSLLRLLLENLLGNAWKYTSKKPAARIEFGMTYVAGEEAFFVRDNGVGFDMAYEQKLFGIFERLHGTEFEGAGIGLATSQRIIKRHGGKIWAEGKVDEGATFYFSLPVFF